MPRATRRVGCAAWLAAWRSRSQSWRSWSARRRHRQASPSSSSPSGNIGCYVFGQGARCDIRNKQWEAPPPPASCELDWGFGLTVVRHGRGNYVCAGDTAIDPGSPVLRYGDRITRGRFRCKSKQSGIRCVNRRNAHGFKISKQRAQLF